LKALNKTTITTTTTTTTASNMSTLITVVGFDNASTIHLTKISRFSKNSNNNNNEKSKTTTNNNSILEWVDLSGVHIFMAQLSVLLLLAIKHWSRGMRRAYCGNHSERSIYCGNHDKNKAKTMRYNTIQNTIQRKRQKSQIVSSSSIHSPSQINKFKPTE
jgi:hypothetical protein